MTEILDLTTDICSDIQQRMHELLIVGDPGIDAILDRILATPGKSIRPLFMRLVAELTEGSWETVCDAAAVVEAIHLASLLHDDVVDQADLRRGDPTVNASHSDKVSVLYGDYIFITALQAAGTLENPLALPVLFDAVRRMVRGEIGDTGSHGDIDESQYFSIIADKTAALFSAAGELAVMLTGGSEQDREWGARLGELVGTAFQVVDDALDYTGVPDRLGKPACSDLRAGTVTLPLIHALRNTPETERSRMLDNGYWSLDERCAFVREHGGIDYALGRAGDLLDEARAMIGTRGSEASRQACEQLFRMILDREA